MKVVKKICVLKTQNVYKYILMIKNIAFQQFESRSYSQNGEDGLLSAIFDKIGFTNHKGLELCCGTGIQCNLTKLCLDKKLYRPLYIDGSKTKMNKGRKWWTKKMTMIKYNNVLPPIMVDTFVTIKNISKILQEYKIIGEMDILSLDMDGIDYWILKEIKKIINPRVIVLEFQDIMGAYPPLTIPYIDDFDASTSKYKWNYCGATLSAFFKLLSEYDLVGTDKKLINAFFVRKDIKHDYEPIKYNELGDLWNQLTKEKQDKLNKRWDKVKHLNWINI